MSSNDFASISQIKTAQSFLNIYKFLIGSFLYNFTPSQKKQSTGLKSWESERQDVLKTISFWTDKVEKGLKSWESERQVVLKKMLFWNDALSLLILINCLLVIAKKKINCLVHRTLFCLL